MDIEGQEFFVDLQSFLEELVEKDMTPAKPEDIQTLPHALQELYALGDGIDLPFGYVYTIAQIQENSKITPFFPDWYLDKTPTVYFGYAEKNQMQKDFHLPLGTMILKQKLMTLYLLMFCRCWTIWKMITWILWKRWKPNKYKISLRLWLWGYFLQKKRRK